MSCYQLLLCLFVSVLVFALLQLANAQHSKYLLDFTCVSIMIFYCRKPCETTGLGHSLWSLINLKLKQFSEEGIENILLAPMFNPLFFFFYWLKLTAARVKLLVTDKFTFVKTQSLKDPYPWSIFICNSVFPPDKGVCLQFDQSILYLLSYHSTALLTFFILFYERSSRADM